ncbi:RNA-binding protein 7 isoform X1 [Sabethes cyaneus]|uniref:RNA-binding protein 7 isoform X1 n=1 Tax=Sabethes cyaneus TaxID=53552 RepID=UPI00237E863F|nr:RNA-binding protein 7 isoform X1 [Sabethes cyaneus]
MMSEEDERTLWCGNLSEKVTEELLYELFVQAGPVEMVKIPKDNDKRQRSYAFITYAHAVSVEYAINIFEGTKLFLRPLTLHRKSKNGANSSPLPRGNPRGHMGGNIADKGQFCDVNISPGSLMAMMGQGNPQMLAMFDQMQQNPLHSKINRNESRAHHQQNHQKPYSRGENQMFSRDRNDAQFSRDRNQRGSHGGGHQRRNDYRGRR